jgi:predicted nucleic acid-binding protein
MSATSDEFLDTNILVYAFSRDPRAEVAEKLLAKGCVISVQGLNEFINVAKRKLGMRWPEVRQALASIRTLCPTILTVDVETHVDAVAHAERYGLGIFDALMIAAAVKAGCKTLWSEDMQDGMVIKGVLRIANPFKAA